MPLLLVRGADRAAVGDVRPAEADLREALALAVARRDTTRRLQALRWLGLALGRQGRTAAAAAVFADLETAAAAAGDSLHLGWAWVGQAYDHYLAGRSGDAAALYGRAAGTLGWAGEPRGAAWAWSGRGLALRQEGRFRAARESFRRVLALAEADGDALNQAVALDQLGRLEMQLGDPGRAEAMFARAEAIHRGRGQVREGLVPAIDLADALREQGRFAEAAALLDSALAVSRDHGLRDLQMLAGCRLADVRLAQGRPAAAARVCREQLAGGEAPSRMVETELRLRLAAALAARDSAQAAADLLAAVLLRGAGAVGLELAVAARLGAHRVDAGDLPGAVAVLEPAAARAQASGLDGVAILALTHLGRAHRLAARPDSAQAAFARAAAAWEDRRRRPDDPVWREHRGDAGDLFAEAAAALLADTRQAGGVAAAFDLVQRGKARTLQERMLGPAARDAASPAPATLAGLQAGILGEGEVLLDLAEGERTAVLFAVRRDTALAVLLPGRRALAGTLQLLGDAVTSPAVQDTAPVLALARAAVAAWPDAVWGMLAGARLVTWSPDGSWHRLPLALLLDPAGGPALARVPSAAVLARTRAGARPADGGLRRILAVCGPDPAGPGTLPGADAETRRLAARYRGVRRVGVTGEPGFDPAAWQEADLLHLAAHTRLDPWQPWNTAITLGRQEGDCPRAADVAQLALDARLAVLSGCTTAGGRVVGGEGLVGLAGGFLAAGVPAVVATLWSVDDYAAARFMQPFYAALAEGRPVAEALAVARAICRADPATAAPRHWAGFVVVGDGTATVPLAPRPVRWPWAAGLLLLAGLAWLRSRR
ncbi:MAG: CHAT domain-containing protein [Candidatus Krumholzibacteriia bacterium]